VAPMMSNSAVTYRDKIYMFAGCHMYNRKRQIRESVPHVSVFDPASIATTSSYVSGEGGIVRPSLKKVPANSQFLIKARKNHCAFVFGKLTKGHLKLS
jgi:hypothetical protein